MSRRYKGWGGDHAMANAAGVIAGEVVAGGKSEGWSGSIEERDAIAGILRPFGIHYVDDMTGTWAKHTSRTASAILARVVADMQQAEELGGPEGDVYCGLMSDIAQEALNRQHTYHTNAGVRTFLLHGGDCDGETMTLNRFLADNEDVEDTKDHEAILALQVGETYESGGGAAPTWSLRRMT